MSTENTKTLAELRQEKSELALKIKELEETPDAKNKPIWFILIRIIAIAVVGAFFLKPVYFIIGIGIFVAIVIIGIIDLMLAKNKNKKRNQKIIDLKKQEAELIARITAENAKNH